MSYINEFFRCPLCGNLQKVPFHFDAVDCIDSATSYTEEVECEKCECVFEAKVDISCDVHISNKGTKFTKKEIKKEIKKEFDPNDISTWEDAYNPKQLQLFKT